MNIRFLITCMLFLCGSLKADDYTPSSGPEVLFARNPFVVEGNARCTKESLHVVLDFEKQQYSIVSKYYLEATDSDLGFAFPIADTLAGDTNKARFERFSISIGNAYLITPEQADSTPDTINWNLTGSGNPFTISIAYSGPIQKELPHNSDLPDYIWRFLLKDGAFPTLTGDTVALSVSWADRNDSDAKDTVPLESAADKPNGYWLKWIKPSGRYSIYPDRVSATILPQPDDSELILRMGPSWLTRRPDIADHAAQFDVSSPSHGRFQEIIRRYERYESSPMMVEQFIQALNPHELFFLRHYIYAKHGHRFEDPRINIYFNALSDNSDRWYHTAQARGIVGFEPYTESLIKKTKKVERQKSGFPRYDEQYGFIIGNYHNFFAFSDHMRRQLLRSFTFDEMYFLARQIHARSGYRFNDIQLIDFFEKWQMEEELGEVGWFDSARNKRYMGLSQEKQSFQDSLLHRVESMLR
ncbi:MAG: YARHG domain-containing protein [Fibrobacterota bacterium]